MTPTCSPVTLLAALGALALASPAAFAGDPSTWACKTCPFEKAGASAAVEVGVGTVSDDSKHVGDYTGFDEKGPYLVLGGEAQWRSDGGLYGRLVASDLGLDTRRLLIDGGLDGRFAFRFGVDESPHWTGDDARTPFRGVGGSTLRLPDGFVRADRTDAMTTLDESLKSADLGFKRTRVDAGGTWFITPAWKAQMDVRHVVRDGTRLLAGSFFSTATQLVAPVDETTDTLTLSASYAGSRLSASASYEGSFFRNGPDAVTWSNPFTALISGADTGQMALAPDNTSHRLQFAANMALNEWASASGQVSWARLTQDQGYLDASLTPSIASAVTLPASSLDGLVDTFHADGTVDARPLPWLRLYGSAARDVRDNRTDSLVYPAVQVDAFVVDTEDRANLPYGYTRDHVRVGADLQGPATLRGSLGFDVDWNSRTYRAVVDTRETTFWGRLRAQPLTGLGFTLKGSHAQRDPSTYGTVTTLDPPNNPLLRQSDLAARRRDRLGLRADWTINETVTVGVSADGLWDDYNETSLGLLDSRQVSLGFDVSAALGEQTRVRGYAQGERARSRQTGSQLFATPDWRAETTDDVDLAGVGVTHSAMGGKLDLSADIGWMRVRSTMRVDAGVAGPDFPDATMRRDSIRLRATYRLREDLWLVGGYAYERLHGSDWRLDGIEPDTVSNLLALGEMMPNDRVHVLQFAVRLHF